MGFLFSIFMFIIVVVLIVVVGGLNILSNIFFRGRARGNANSSRQYNSRENSQRQAFQEQASKKKIISKDEGEYIDFEEMK